MGKEPLYLKWDKMKKCPISGIDCDECGYHQGCAIYAIVEALEGIATVLKESFENK